MVTYLCIQTVWTYNGMEDVLEGCGDARGVVLHCTLFLAWALGGGNCMQLPPAPSNDAEMTFVCRLRKSW